MFLDGEYHLFYQHNPEGDRWGHISWGHAVSRDLLGLGPPAHRLAEPGRHHDLLGECRLRREEFVRPGEERRPADGRGLHRRRAQKQTQNLATSLDKGRTWTKFAGDPVLDLNSNSFRDPKVFWHKPTGRWIMATVLADDRKVRLWGSTDLKAWERLSDFGPAGSVKGVWECPELFEAPVVGGEKDRVAVGPQGRRERRSTVRRLGGAILRGTSSTASGVPRGRQDDRSRLGWITARTSMPRRPGTTPPTAAPSGSPG